MAYALTPTATAPGTATSSSYAVNAVSTWTFPYRNSNAERVRPGYTFTLTFPTNFGASTVTAVTLGGSAARSWSWSGSTLTVVSNTNLNKNANFNIVVTGLTNPSQPAAATSYPITGTGQTSAGTFNTAFTPGAAITAPATAVTVQSCVVDTSAVSVGSTYTVSFTLGALGRLAGTTAGGPNTVTITFPSNTTVPASISAASVTINGVAPSAVSASGRAVTLSMPAGMTIANSGAATVQFSQAAGLVNPSVINLYTVAVSTSAQTANGTSPTYNIGGYVATNIVLSSANQPVAGFTRPGQSIAVDGFHMQRIAGSQGATVTAVTIDDAGTTPATAISGVSIYRDNGDNSFGPGDTLLNATPATFVGTSATVTFDAANVQGFQDGSVDQYWVVYAFSATALNGWTASSQVTTFTTTAPLSSDTAGVGAVFTIDTIGPVVSWTDPSVDSTTLTDPGPAVVGGTGADAGAGVASIGVQIQRTSDSYWWNGTAWASTPATLTAAGTLAWGYTWALIPPDQNATETYTLYATGTDAAGNVGSTAVRTGIHIDNMGPTVSSAVALNATHVDVTFSESLAPTSSLAAQFSIPGLTVSAASIDATTPSIVHLTTSTQSVGANYTVTVALGSISDLVGNPNEAPNSATFLSGAIPSVAVTQGSGAGRPTAQIFKTHDATAAVDEILLTASGGTSNVATITVRGLDTASALRADVARVTLFRDNGDGVFGAGDTAVSTAQTFSADASGTAVVFSNVNASVVPGSPAAFWIVYKIGPTPNSGDQVGSRLVSGDVASTNATVPVFATIVSANSGKTILIDAVPPTTPASVHANPTSPSSVEVTWTACTDALSGMAFYNIYRDGSLVASTSSSATSYTATGLSPGGTYTFAVTAVDRAGNESAATAAAQVTVPSGSVWMTITTSGSGLSVDLGSIDPGSPSTTTSGTTLAIGGVGASQYTMSVSAADFSNTTTPTTTPTMPVSVMSYIAHSGSGVTYGPTAFSNVQTPVCSASTGTPYVWQQNYVIDYLMNVSYGYEPGVYKTGILFTIIQN